MTTATRIIAPQPGPQTEFMSTPVDIALYGGAAGGGKSFALLLECTRHFHVTGFGAVIFRRTTPQIRNKGALWDQSKKIFYHLRGTPLEIPLKWRFGNDVTVEFSHMQHENDCEDWQGSELPLIGFDELTHFTKKQFIYLLSRSRTMIGIKPYIRCTTNPDSESWVAEFISWYWDPDTGYAIPERSGKIRYFIVYDEEFHWGDSVEELHERFDEKMGAENVMPLSFTFIAAKLDDNKLLEEADPTYRAKLMAMSEVERERLLKGNWKISAGDGILKSQYMRYYTTLPEVKFYSWSWDTAIKEGQENDYSAGQLWAACNDGYYLVRRHKVKMDYPKLKRLTFTSFQDHPALELLIEDKASGQQLIQDFQRIPPDLEAEFRAAGRRIIPMPVIKMMPDGKSMAKTKIERVNFVATLFEAGRIFVPDPSLPGNEWVREMILEWTKFPNGSHDDEVDAMSQYLTRRIKFPDVMADSIGTPISTGGSLADMHQTYLMPAHLQ